MAAIYQTGKEISTFCLQVSLLLGAGIPLSEGLSVMAEDAVKQEEKALLKSMADDVEMGDPFFSVLERTEAFPPYVVRMAKLGQQSGTLDTIMKSLAVYYEKEYFMKKNIRNALTYPIMMAVMLFAILFVLFTRVMPVFTEVYAQLGVQLSPLAQTASQLGGILSGTALVLFVLTALIAAAAVLLSYMGRLPKWSKKLIEWVKSRNRTALAVAGRRFCAVLALTIKSGMELEKGLELAGELVDNEKVEEQIRACELRLQDGVGYFEAMRDTGLFRGFHVQMLKVGSRSGRLDEIMENISGDFERQADDSIDQMISRLEPTMIAILAVAVGMILLSVMLPLAGVLAGVG